MVPPRWSPRPTKHRRFRREQQHPSRRFRRRGVREFCGGWEQAVRPVVSPPLAPTIEDERNMRRSHASRRNCLAVAAAALALTAAPLARAAENPAATAPGHTLYADPAVSDISGLWLANHTAAPGTTPMPGVDGEFIQWAPWPAPLTPAYRKRADEYAAANKLGRTLNDSGARCLPYGIPFVLDVGAYPEEIVQSPGVVSFLGWGVFPIMVWTDGRPHPKDLTPSYNGHSTGYWIGDTLYVDTVGILDATLIDAGPRTPHSDKLHMKWTVQRVAADVLHVHMVLYDPEAFAEPMVLNNIWRRKAGPGWQMLDDGSCFENNRNQPDDTGATGFTKF
jgi:hypothetical protein